MSNMCDKCITMLTTCGTQLMHYNYYHDPDLLPPSGKTYLLDCEAYNYTIVYHINFRLPENNNTFRSSHKNVKYELNIFPSCV